MNSISNVAYCICIYTYCIHYLYYSYYKQIAKSIGILSRMRFYLSCKIKLMLYYTLIYPYITYCNSTWSSTYVSNLNRIYLLQKQAVRAVTNSEYRAHTAPLFTKLKLFTKVKFTILYQGPRVSNCLPASITNLSNFPMFKSKVLEFLLK